ncbi:MAG: SagB/ThcOx family dehydrogenase [Nitrospirota bacterium]
MGTDREQARAFLKDTVRRTIDFTMTDQSRGVAAPPLEKPYPADARRIDLAAKDTWRGFSGLDLVSAIEGRRSHRSFTGEPLTQEELSFLLWATQGIRQKAGSAMAFRTVPSAGCRHALETYCCVLNVTGIEPGIYRYLPVEHQLLVVSRENDLAQQLTTATLGQSFIGRSAVTFVWTTVPYRMEWRYANAAHKVIALDAGHVCQNLYLASAAINCGTCAVAAYHQEQMDLLLGVDGEEEFTLYLAPVGRVRTGE